MSEMDQLVYAPRPLKGQRFAVSATADVTELFSYIAKPGWVRVVAEGADVDVLFGESGIGAVVKAKVSADEDDEEVGYPVKSGTYHDFWITGKVTHISWDASGAGFIYLCRAGRESTGRQASGA